MVTPAQVIFLHAALSISILNVWFAALNEFWSKKRLSAELGGHPKEGPPELNDHLLPSLQSPVPPIQYMFLGLKFPKLIPLLFGLFIELFAVKVVDPIPVKLMSCISK